MDRCFLYCAGEYADGYISPHEGDAVAAVDGGLALTKRLGLVPHAVIGDFDSLGHIPNGANVIRYPAEKDDTDTAIACEYFLQRGYKSFYILGAVGGRPDHTYANIGLLYRLAQEGAQGFIFAHDFVFTAIKNSSLGFDSSYRGYISVFPMAECAKGVNITGLKYTLCDALLTNGNTLGVSNEFMARSAMVSVSDGTLLIMFERKEALPLPKLSEVIK